MKFVIVTHGVRDGKKYQSVSKKQFDTRQEAEDYIAECRLIGDNAQMEVVEVEEKQS